MAKKRKMPRDINERAKKILDILTGDEPEEESKKNPAAVELGRLGGKKGGKARDKALSDDRKKEIAIKAAEARWKNHKSKSSSSKSG